MNFEFQRLQIPEIVLIEGRSFEDSRGAFWEGYKERVFAEHGISGRFVQDNFSHSVKGVLRGLHFQKGPVAQGKLIIPLRGEIFDVAVDIRRGSPTYAKWVAVILSSRGLRMVYVPPGFAHGLCVLSEEADVMYKVTQEYAPEADRGIIWNDPSVNVQWPVATPLLSQKDLRLPLLEDADHDFTYRMDHPIGAERSNGNERT